MTMFKTNNKPLLWLGILLVVALIVTACAKEDAAVPVFTEPSATEAAFLANPETAQTVSSEDGSYEAVLPDSTLKDIWFPLSRTGK